MGNFRSRHRGKPPNYPLQNPRKQLGFLPRTCRQTAAICRNPSNQTIHPRFWPAFSASIHPIRLIARKCGPNPRYLTNTLSIPSSKNSQKHHDSAQKQRQVSGNFGTDGELRFCRGTSNPVVLQQYLDTPDQCRAAYPTLPTNTLSRPGYSDDTPSNWCSKNPQKQPPNRPKSRQVPGNFGRVNESRFCRGTSNATVLQLMLQC